MAVDKGGLIYPINVQYDPAAAARFRADIEAARQAYQQFRAEVQGSASAFSGVASAQKRLIASSKSTNAAIAADQRGMIREVAADFQKSIKQFELQRKQAAAAQVAAVRQAAEAQLAEERRLVENTVRLRQEARKLETQLSRAHAQEERQLRVERERAEKEQLLQAVGRQQEERKQANALRAAHAQEERQLRAAQNFRRRVAALAEQDARRRAAAARAEAAAAAETVKGANDTNNAVSRLFFTFRRLVGVLALFQAARFAFRSFVDIVKGGVEFNAVIESSRLSVTGLILSLTDVVDAQGRVVTGAQAIAFAQQEAAKQTEALRKDALSTTASFTDLVETFQTAVGPGIQAGLRLDEIRQLAVRVAQVAPLVGLLQNQLAEEIRSLTTGTIRAQTSRIATVFGITSADITRAKEAGRLAEFLEERFRGIKVIGDQIQFTLDGIKNRLGSAFSVATGAASGGLFEEIKQTLIDITNILTDPQSLQPRPEVVGTFKLLFDALTNIVRAARRVINELDFDRVRERVGVAADVIQKLGISAIGAAQGAVQAFGPLLSILKQVLDLIGFGNEQTQQSVALFVRLFLTLKTANLAIGAFQNGLLALPSALGKIELSVGSIAKGLQGWTTIIAAATTGIDFLATKFFQRELDLQKLIDEETLRANGVAFVLRQDAAKQNLDNLINSLPSFVQRAIGAAEREFDKLKKSLEPQVAPADLRPRGTPATDEELDAIRIQQQRAALVKAETLSVGLIASLRRGMVADEAISVQEARNELRILELQLAQLKENNKIEEERLGNKLLAAQTGPLEEQKTLELQLSALAELHIQEENQIEFAIAAANQQRELAVRLETEAAAKRKEQVADTIRAANLTALQAQADAEIVALQQAGVRNATIALRQSERELEVSQLRRRQLVEAQALPRQQLEQEVERLPRGSAQREEAQARLNALVLEQAAAQAAINAQIDAATLKLQEQQEISEGSFFGGALRGLQRLKQELPTSFEQGIAAAQQIFTDFASLVSDTIVDAFDPTNETTLRERFAAFFSDIARLLLNQAVTNIIAALIPQQVAATTIATTQVTAATTAAGIITTAYAAAAATEISAASTAAAIRAGASIAGGFHGGGLVRGFNQGGVAGYAHSMARGYAAGGPIARPAHIHPRDTVPAWLEPNEFVHPVARVRQYGLDLMRRLQSGAANPAAVRAAAGLGGRPAAPAAAVSVRGPVGMADGGSVPAASGGQGGPIPAVVVFNEKTLYDMLSANRAGMLRFYRENAYDLDAALRRSRGRA